MGSRGFFVKPTSICCDACTSTTAALRPRPRPRPQSNSRLLWISYPYANRTIEHAVLDRITDNRYRPDMHQANFPE